MMQSVVTLYKNIANLYLWVLWLAFDSLHSGPVVRYCLVFEWSNHVGSQHHIAHNRLKTDKSFENTLFICHKLVWWFHQCNINKVYLQQ